MKLSASPSRAICAIGILLVPNTIAFGGVATGSMNAQLALIAAGTMSSAGSTSTAMTAANRISMPLGFWLHFLKNAPSDGCV